MRLSKIASTSSRDTDSPGLISPAASSTFFCLYSCAFTSCRSRRPTAAVATSKAQTTLTAVANSTV